MLVKGATECKHNKAERKQSEKVRVEMVSFVVIYGPTM